MFVKKKWLIFDGTKVVKTLKNKFGCHSNEVKPLYFVVVVNITAKIGRNTSELLLNATLIEKKIRYSFKNMPRLARYLKWVKTPKMHCCQHNLNPNYPN